MNLEKAHSNQLTSGAPCPDKVVISRWVNERFPDWEQILSAHDVARLTRRPRWLLLSMMLVGRFPQRRRFHGRGIGWMRSDIVHWLARDLRPFRCKAHSARVLRSSGSWQMAVPLDCARARIRRRRRARFRGNFGGGNDSGPTGGRR